MSIALWIQPLDVLYLRGNKLFGEAGDDATAQMPPWPSVAAGAIRSRMLVDAKVSLHKFAHSEAKLADELQAILGSPQEPGTFRLQYFGLARKVNGKVELLFPLPADLVVRDSRVISLEPTSVDGVISSNPLPYLAVLRTGKQAKAESGYWLNQAGLQAYLSQETIQKDHILHADTLWKIDPRLGIGLNADSGTADDGRIYTSDAAAMAKEVGFVALIEGASQDDLPTQGLLRFGGDGRAAEVALCQTIQWPQVDLGLVQKTGRFRLILTSPGVFENGWGLPGLEGERWHCEAGSARLVAAAVANAEVVSGWDVARHQPKPAQRVAPIGSVYWFEDWQGDTSGLEKLVQQGLPCLDKTRRVEGFNHCLITVWNHLEKVNANH